MQENYLPLSLAAANIAGSFYRATRENRPDRLFAGCGAQVLGVNVLVLRRKSGWSGDDARKGMLYCYYSCRYTFDLRSSVWPSVLGLSLSDMLGRCIAAVHHGDGARHDDSCTNYMLAYK